MLPVRLLALVVVVDEMATFKLTTHRLMRQQALEDLDLHDFDKAHQLPRHDCLEKHFINALDKLQGHRVGQQLAELNGAGQELQAEKQEQGGDDDARDHDQHRHALEAPRTASDDEQPSPPLYFHLRGPRQREHDEYEVLQRAADLAEDGHGPGDHGQGADDVARQDHVLVVTLPLHQVFRHPTDGLPQHVVSLEVASLLGLRHHSLVVQVAVQLTLLEALVQHGLVLVRVRVHHRLDGDHEEELYDGVGNEEATSHEDIELAEEFMALAPAVEGDHHGAVPDVWLQRHCHAGVPVLHSVGWPRSRVTWVLPI
mmetsp:Transcript_114907/g.320094  ORF Transcript_114907/g.320094 Transcript_114907/m.320094 type:complete len:313 (-) Transcript_114907:380-1318(-)